jgi:hypothetical protein
MKVTNVKTQIVNLGLTGEWRNSGRRFKAGMVSRLAMLFGGIAIVAASALV